MHPFLKSLLKLFLYIVVFFGSIAVCILGFIIVIAVIAASVAVDSEHIDDDYVYSFGKEESDNKLLSIPVEGIILGNRATDNPFEIFSESGVTYGYDVKDALRAATQEKDIKGVVLEINSPGGTIFGSRAIADGIRYYKDTTKKPVIVFASGLIASGGYMAALPADVIYADYGSTIGSIGVIFGPFKYYDTVISESGNLFEAGVVTQNGIETTYFTGGKGKDLGNPYRKLTPEEITVLQGGVNNEYNDFVKLVTRNRSISESTVKDRIGAYVYDNKAALDLKLIDGTKTRESSYVDLAQRAQLSRDDFQIVKENSTRGFFEELFAVQSRFTTIEKTTSICPSSGLLFAYYGDLSEVCQ